MKNFDERMETLDEMIADEFGRTDEYLDALINTLDEGGSDHRRLCLLEYLRRSDEGLTSVEIDVCGYDEKQFSSGSAEYLVLTEDEANEAWEESLDIYLDECVYPELSGGLAAYFDEAAWRRDARFDGRGHCLSSYDGSEDASRIYCIFRVN